MDDFCVRCNDLGPPDYSFRVFIPVQSHNVISGNMGGGRWRYGKERNAWASGFTRVLNEGLVTKAHCRRVVRLTREYGTRKRELDYGNLVGGAKLVVDAMQRQIGGKKKPIDGAGIIIDDSGNNFIGLYRQVRSSVDATYFEIWDYPVK